MSLIQCPDPHCQDGRVEKFRDVAVGMHREHDTIDWEEDCETCNGTSRVPRPVEACPVHDSDHIEWRGGRWQCVGPLPIRYTGPICQWFGEDDDRPDGWDDAEMAIHRGWYVRESYRRRVARAIKVARRLDVLRERADRLREVHHGEMRRIASMRVERLEKSRIRAWKQVSDELGVSPLDILHTPPWIARLPASRRRST